MDKGHGFDSLLGLKGLRNRVDIHIFTVMTHAL